MSKARPPGFIQIHRTMLDWEWYQDDRCVRMLLHLLLKANHTEAKWKGLDISPGDVITSTVSLADQLGWSRSAVNRTLEKLKACGEVDTKSDNKRTLVSLIKWAKYQGEWSKSDSKPDSKRTSNGQQTGQQTDTVKEGEELKKEKNTTPSGVVKGAIVIDGFLSEEFALAWAGYEIMRKKINKPMTDFARTVVIKKLTAWGELVAIESLKNSITSNWTDVYYPKSQRQTATDQRRSTTSDRDKPITIGQRQTTAS